MNAIIIHSSQQSTVSSQRYNKEKHKVKPLFSFIQALLFKKIFQLVGVSQPFALIFLKKTFKHSLLFSSLFRLALKNNLNQKSSITL